MPLQCHLQVLTYERPTRLRKTYLCPAGKFSGCLCSPRHNIGPSDALAEAVCVLVTSSRCGYPVDLWVRAEGPHGDSTKLVEVLIAPPNCEVPIWRSRLIDAISPSLWTWRPSMSSSKSHVTLPTLLIGELPCLTREILHYDEQATEVSVQP